MRAALRRVSLIEQTHQREHRMREHRIGHGDIDMAPLAAGSCVHQRGEYAHRRRERAAEQVGDLEVRHHRCAPLGADLLADARVADVVDVVAGAQRVGTVLPVTGDRAIDDARVDRIDRRVAHAELVHHTRTKALDDDIGVFGEPQEHVAPRRGLEVQAQRALVAVDEPEQFGHALAHASHRARVITGTRVLDLDHVGAHVGQVHGRHRAG